MRGTLRGAKDQDSVFCAKVPIPNTAGVIRTMVIAPRSSGIRQCPVPGSGFVLLHLLHRDADDHHRHSGCASRLYQFVDFALLSDHLFSERHAALRYDIHPLFARFAALLGRRINHREILCRLLRRIGSPCGRSGLGTSSAGRWLLLDVLRVGGGGVSV